MVFRVDRHYAYYRCETRGCEAKSKSVPRARMEEVLAEILKGLQPARGLFQLAKAMLRDAWNMRLALALDEKDAVQKQLLETDSQIEGLLDRIVEATSASVVSAYETCIEKLEQQRIIPEERLERSVPPKGRLEDCMELALKFSSSPWNIYQNGDFSMRQTELRLAFSEPLRYSQYGMYGTPVFAFPFRYLRGISVSKSEMVLLERIELSTSPFDPRRTFVPVWGLDYPLTVALLRALGPARLVSTPSRISPGLARDWHWSSDL